ncbi:hypothetical protein [Mycolicibacterium sp. GF69]|nr:hypothetical protein [Mycolicibacterium sp. GF69]
MTDIDQSEAPLLGTPIDYLRSGVEAGMNLPDAPDTTLITIRVVAS